MNQPELLEKLASGTATPADYQHFTEWFDNLPETEQQQVLHSYEALISQQAGGTIPATIAQKIADRVKTHEQQQQKAKVISLVRFAAAAAVAALVAGITWFAWQPRKTTQTAIPSVATTPIVHDKDPATQGAILTLADGSKIVLDSIGNGSIANQSGVQVIKKDGQVIYTTPQQSRLVPAHDQPPVAYNTMSTPRGRQFQLILPDGSKIWLNAASSIRYPTYFTGEERLVYITGEAYFEVAKNAAMPFKVKFNTPSAGFGQVEVLGTHFNINTYDDEASVKATLLEGKVKLMARQPVAQDQAPQVILTPGKQAILSMTTDQSPQIKVSTADTDEVMAWKNGRFQFNDAPIKDIMRQAARWYDVEVIYQKTIPEKKFTADLSRQTRLSEFLKVLELSGYRFTIDAKTLTVTL